MADDKLSYTQNRELSWLRFNERVLEEAKDSKVPLLERLKFTAIFTSNLAEFFMVRVGSLYVDIASGKEKQDKCSAMTPKKQLKAIYAACRPLYEEREKVYSEIKKKLSGYGIDAPKIKELSDEKQKFVKKYFKEQILPVLSPQIVDTGHLFPHLVNQKIYVIALLKKGTSSVMGIVPVSSYIPEVLYLPGEGIGYIRMEKIIMEYLEMVFDGYQIKDRSYICVTRNCDIAPDGKEYAQYDDFRVVMRNVLSKRGKMAAVRLETAFPLKKDMEKFLCSKLKITPHCIFQTEVPMKMDYIYQLIDRVPEKLKKDLLETPFTPCRPAMVYPGSVMEQIEKKDILLSYPYESMEPFLQMIKEAAFREDVMSIKITIYRLARKSRLVEYLCAAAENGKEVTVLIELRARFDEQNNIDWSERLEAAGCKVIYGMEGYKVHSKICLITYKKGEKLHYLTQVGTGNYNENTAKLYTDYSLMTANREIGEDAVLFFQHMLVGNLKGKYRHLLAAPGSLKKEILRLMDEEIAKGSQGRILMKMNSVTDMDFIHKTVEASKAGVNVDLIVRGICCILPGVKNETDNLTVTSIVGRYLEHARVFVFGEGTNRKIYLSSADMMTRNTEKRVEIACPVYNPQIQEHLLHCLNIMLKDEVKARRMQADGTYIRKGDAPICAQEIFMREALEAETLKKKEKNKQKISLFRWLKHLFNRSKI